MFIFVFSCYFVFDVEMKNDKELFNVLFFVFLIRKKKWLKILILREEENRWLLGFLRSILKGFLLLFCVIWIFY